MSTQPAPLPWLEPGQEFPSASEAWGKNSHAPGLLAAGGALDLESLFQAYSHAIFPWFSEGQPILWWSPNPRMVLDISEFRLHRSFKKTLRKFSTNHNCEIRIDSAFAQVIQYCSTSPREGQTGTWIVPEMMKAYCEMHKAGFAHSVETWINGELVGGLYCVAIGKSVFGESMFSRLTDASKIALAALVCFCRFNTITQIDCQQNTLHLASLGARELSRDAFIKEMTIQLNETKPVWQFTPVMWQALLESKSTPT